MTTNVLSLKAKTPISEAQAQMRAAEIRHLPVEDDRGHVIGIVSDRDVLRAHGSGGLRKGSPKTVAEIMTKRIETVRPETPAYEAAEMMLERKIGSLPVIGEDEQLVGVITETDFLRFAKGALAAKPMRTSDPSR